MGRSRPAAYSGMQALEVVLQGRARSSRRAGSVPYVVAGSWRIGTDEVGNLVAVHGSSGEVTVLAEAPPTVDEGGSGG